jgi:Alginate export
MIHPKIQRTSLTLGIITALGFSSAGFANTLEEAFSQGKADVNFRYRVETVDQDNALKDATAATLRTRFGFTTGDYKNFKARIEFEYLNVAGSHDYNSTQNGLSQFSTVADPRTEELNQAWLEYSGISNTAIKGGRQRIILDNARFVGNVGWRQNEQTFDALMIKNTSIDNITITFGNIFQVNTITGGQQETSHNVLNIGVDKTPVGKVSIYAYLLDYDAIASAQNDRNTMGARVKGNAGDVLYTVELAKQSDSGDYAGDLSASYLLAEIGYKIDDTKLFIGQETLGSDNSVDAFETPLATKHAFNGWADQFLSSTPNTGLNDLYVKAVTKVSGMKLVGVYHDFSADEGNNDFGTELDVLLVKPFNKNVKGLIKFSDFSADATGGKVDTQKIWLALEAKFSQ